MKDKKKAKRMAVNIANIILLSIILYKAIATNLFLDARLNYRLISAPVFQIGNEESYKPLTEKFKKITLVGESHGMEKTYSFLENLLKTMNKDNKIDYLVIEASPSDAAIINFYLKSGERNYLFKFISNKIGTAMASQEFVNMINTVKEINQHRQVPIRFIGVDLEDKEDTLLYYLKQVLGPFADNSYVKEMWLMLSKATTFSPEDSKKFLSLFIESEEMLPLKKEEIFDMKMALTQRYSEKGYLSSDVIPIRDKKMTECFMAYKKYLPEGYFLVNMGSNHISNNNYTSDGQEVESFALLLNKEPQLQRQLYTINLEYLDSQSMFGQELGKSELVSTLPYITFLKLQDKILYPNTKEFNRVEDWKKLKRRKSIYNMPDAIIIFVNSKAVNATDIRF